MSDTPTKAGFVALIGAPNAGKSTLLNALVGTKLSIVSPKVQTTRTRVLGIVNDGPVQMLFVDTPGIFSPKRKLDEAMVSAAWTGAEDADHILLLADGTLRGLSQETLAIVARLQAAGRRVDAVLTKIDRVQPLQKLLPLAAALAETGIVDEVFMVSGTTSDGLDRLRARIAERLPAGPWLYPDDDLTDVPMRLLAAELTREQLFLQLRNELPYASTVETDKWEEREDGSVAIHQTIWVERDGQKAIVLGKGGQQIRAIGERARAEIERLLERRAHLFLFVKARVGWDDDPERLRAMGLDPV